MKKDQFDPGNIGAEARQKLVFNAMVLQIADWFKDPPVNVIRILLDGANIKNVRESRLQAEFAPLAQKAFEETLNNEILSRVGFSRQAPQTENQTQQTASTPSEDDKAEVQESAPKGKIITTERELALFKYVRQRLAFLVKTEDSFQKIENIRYKDQVTKFSVFYKSQRKGKILDFFDNDGPGWRITFVGGEKIEVEELGEIDADLLRVFEQVVTEIG